jgi:hypothetical protein
MVPKYVGYLVARQSILAKVVEVLFWIYDQRRMKGGKSERKTEFR